MCDERICLLIASLPYEVTSRLASVICHRAFLHPPCEYLLCRHSDTSSWLFLLPLRNFDVSLLSCCSHLVRLLPEAKTVPGRQVLLCWPRHGRKSLSSGVSTECLAKVRWNSPRSFGGIPCALGNRTPGGSVLKLFFGPRMPVGSNRFWPFFSLVVGTQ